MSEKLEVVVTKKPNIYILSILLMSFIGIGAVVLVPISFLFRAYMMADKDLAGGFGFLSFLAVLVVVASVAAFASVASTAMERLK